MWPFQSVWWDVEHLKKHCGSCGVKNEKAGISPASHSMSPSDGSFMHPKVCTMWFIRSGSYHRVLAFQCGSGQNGLIDKRHSDVVKGDY
jgi:hypothetical protein